MILSFLAGTLVWLYRDRWIPLESVDRSLISRPLKQNAEAAGDSAGQQSDGPVSINRADRETLMSLNGIGPVMADRIIEHRERQQFRSLEELMNVRGIGRKTYLKLKPHIAL